MDKVDIRLSDLVLLAIGLFIFNLLFLGGHHLVSPDETRYVGIAWEMFKHDNYTVPTIAGSPFLGKPILFYWLNIFAFKLFGVNEFAARFFPAVLVTLTALFSYISASIVFNRRVALLSAILIAITPLFFALGHYANMDGEVACWLNLCLFSLIIALYLPVEQRGRSLWLYLAYVFAALAFLTKGLIGIVFPAMVLFFWFLLVNNWRLLLKIRLVSGLILFLIIILPWFLIVESKYPGFMSYFFIWNQVVRFVGDNFNMHNPFYYYVLLVIGGVFPWTFYFFQTYVSQIKLIWRKPQQYKIELFLLLWVILITIFFSIPTSKLPGYIGPVFPASAMLMAIYFDRLWRTTLSKVNQVATTILAVIFVLAALTLLLLPIFWHDKAVYLTMPYGYFLAIVLAVGAISLFVGLRRKKPLKWFVITVIIVNILMNLTLIAAIKYFRLQWNYPIAEKVEPVLKRYPNAQVFMLGRYYYAMPLYLDRDIGIVADWDKGQNLGDNWKREIYEGVNYLHHLPKDLVTYRQFSEIWNKAEKSHQPIIVITSDNPTSQQVQRLIDHSSYQLIGEVPRRGAYIITNASKRD
ncbi:glycosyltransferase family 39 protein [Thiotrichales bacterium 19S3-7]|nr:glycosyltransferase family 39 protein [Thiotrichales bacterium 19S3-7]MCF6802279.1 glycosyltransferase family 39 protein [Thiotrichales bacterium 19S3-11]